MGTFVAGIDIGTSGAKGMVFDLQGNALGNGHRECPCIYPRPGGVEQDADLLVESTMQAMSEAVRASNVPPEAIVSLSHTRFDIARAFMEGITLDMKDMIGTVRGAAILGWAAVSSSIEEGAEAMVRLDEPFEPIPENVETHARRYDAYCRGATRASTEAACTPSWPTCRSRQPACQAGERVNRRREMVKKILVWRRWFSAFSPQASRRGAPQVYAVTGQVSGSCKDPQKRCLGYASLPLRPTPARRWSFLFYNRTVCDV